MRTIGITIIVVVVVFGGFMAISLLNSGSKNITSGNGVDSVSIVDGKQIIKIRAKGGYQPRGSLAKAGLPTIIEFDSRGTFDCSSFIRIPSMNISRSLSSSEITYVDLGTPSVVKLQGSCGMGMYPFEINFE
ncbi:MAG: hypothetical protein UT43_C0009G0013 [Parcubacteria group bacterium GW2011_GWC1_39_29]|uniref:EfeO-type cupredoxin-like domain-containing protein n=1 Tax=Candidatus Yanofskybacteria bacterium GW2011_GWD1_39_16 TaxID=1619030 RepID=A0A837HUF6_9BACT|nr:MAG: hypothetical protein UT35_C0005G0003 [Candidatus Yanofskybacteria bacterium GW2011_GWD1_39_16]KKR15038.1 MAG: hypothetical protein UT43_C0009G0013 [Parcubacteria group bacterium GW2011_GWC1_39_29]